MKIKFKILIQSNWEEVFLPFFARDEEQIPTNLADKSEFSTVFRSSKGSKPASPYDHRHFAIENNHDLPLELNSFMEKQVKRNTDSNLSKIIIIREGHLSWSSQKEKALKRHEESSIPVKARTFHFSGVDSNPRHINRREYLRSAKERQAYCSAKEKPIFLVTTNIKGWIEESLKGANRKIANQRQVIINSASSIYNQMK